MAAALMSNLSSVLNSASTLVTIDFYKKFVRPAATERQQVRFGQLSGTVILLLGIAIALIYSTQKDPLFVQVQRVFFFIAPPFAVIFTLGLLWRRANAAAAVATVALGFPFSAFLTLYAFPHWAFLKPYNTYQHPALVAWVFCMGVMIATSLVDRPAAAGEDDRHHLVGPVCRACPRTSAPATRASRTGGSGGFCSSRPCCRFTRSSSGSVSNTR